MSNFEKMIKESFESHHREAKRILNEKKKKEIKFNKFLFLDFDNTLYDKESDSIIDGEAYSKLIECLEDPEPCYISIVTARRSDSKQFIESKIKEELEDLFEQFKGKFYIETVLDNSPESKPSIYDAAMLKADCIFNIIQNNCENLQQILVFFYDDVEENIEMVSKTLDSMNILTDNCYLV